MTGRHVVDSDVLIPFLNGDTAVTDLVISIAPYLSVVVLGELRYGAANSKLVEQNQERADQVELKLPLLRLDRETARLFGELKSAD